MAWRLARSLEQLRRQIDAAYPGRSKASDGTIGDAAHSKRKSDHNPDADGTVDALDITHDPANGLDIQVLCDALVASRDPRISYIICNGKIISGRKGPSPWQPRRYRGANPHDKHIHISVLDEGQDDERPWNIVLHAARPDNSVLKRGSKGPFVRELQENLNALGYGPLEADGIFGSQTEIAVRAFQSSAGLTVDGWAGPRTLKAIGEEMKALSASPTVDETVREAKRKTSLWGWLTTFLGGGGAGLTALFGSDWRTVIAFGAVMLAGLLILIVLGPQIVRAIGRIRDAVEGRA